MHAERLTMRDGTPQPPAVRLDLLDTGYRLNNFVVRREMLATQALAPQPRFFCSHCGSPEVVWCAQGGDDRERRVCRECGSVHYQNPKIVVRCVAEYRGRLLLCRRADDPRRGLWCTPGGYLESGESLHDAAIREAREETRAAIADPRLVAIHEMPQLREVIMLYRAHLLDANVAAGEESLEAALFDPAELPWHQLAFPTDFHALRWMLDPASDTTVPHVAEFFWHKDGRILMRPR